MELLGLYRLKTDYEDYRQGEQCYFYGQLLLLNKNVYLLAVSVGTNELVADHLLEINRFAYFEYLPTKDVIYKSMCNLFRFGRKAVYYLEQVDGKPLDYNFVPFELYDGGDCLTPKAMIDTRLNENDIVRLKSQDKWNMYPIVAFGEDESGARYFDNPYYGTIEVRPFTKLYCSKCGHVFLPRIYDTGYHSSYRIMCGCPNCDNNSSTVIFSKDYQDFLGKHFAGYCSNTIVSVTENGYFVQPIENGIVLSRFMRKLRADKGYFLDEYVITHRVVHQIGGEIGAYRCWKNGRNNPCDVFDALHINSKSSHFIGQIVYEGSNNFIEFARNNERFLRMSGFLEISKYARNVADMQSFFVLFIGIMNKYPIFEQLVKMGYVYLFFDLYSAILKSESKVEIAEIVNGLSELIDMDTMQGSHALRFPAYIGEYLRSKSAKLPEYYVWRDIYELTGLTKENFLKVVNSVEYSLIVPYIELESLVNILKFDYVLPKLLKYLLKDVRDCADIRERVELLSDYLVMCDVLQVTIDKYPQNLKLVHDRLAKEYKSVVSNDGRDDILYRVGSTCEDYVMANTDEDTVGVPKLLEKFVVICPKSVADFIDEGNQQHNCVGYYPDLVLKGDTVVFFIRSKENPFVSFITGECTKSGLGQLYYSNNRRVMNADFVNLGKWVARRILQGCKSRRIFGLQNVSFKK